MLPRKYRLRLTADIERVRRHGRVQRHPLIVLQASKAPAGRSASRFAFLASRRVGGAVRRNRCRRLMREAVRRHLPSIAPGWHCLLIARPALAAATFGEVDEAIVDLLLRSRILGESATRIAD